jgi:hypothetical protein
MMDTGRDTSKAVLGGAHMSHILLGIAIYLCKHSSTVQDSGGGTAWIFVGVLGYMISLI